MPQHQSYLTLQTSLLKQSSINFLSILVIFVSAQSSLNLPKLLSMTLYSNEHQRKQSLVGIISTGYVINNFLFIEHHLILISHHLITSFSPLLFRIGISHPISPSYYIVLPGLFLLISSSGINDLNFHTYKVYQIPNNFHEHFLNFLLHLLKNFVKHN